MRTEFILHKFFYRKTVERLERKEVVLKRKSVSVYTFLVYRIIFCLIIFLLFFNLPYIIMPYNLILASVLTIVYYIASEYIYYNIPIKDKAREIEKDALYYFQLLSLALDQSSIKMAIKLTSETVDSEFSKELGHIVTETNKGKQMNQLLLDYANLIPSSHVQMMIRYFAEELNVADTELSSFSIQLEDLKQVISARKKRKFLRFIVEICILFVIYIVFIFINVKI